MPSGYRVKLKIYFSNSCMLSSHRLLFVKHQKQFYLEKQNENCSVLLTDKEYVLPINGLQAVVKRVEKLSKIIPLKENLNCYIQRYTRVT